jgi:hypothetical protein
LRRSRQNAFLNSGAHGLVLMTVRTNGQDRGFNFPLTFEGTFGTSDRDGLTQPLHVYADPGSLILIEGDRDNSTGGSEFTFEVSGYLVSCGSGTGSCPLP